MQPLTHLVIVGLGLLVGGLVDGGVAQPFPEPSQAELVRIEGAVSVQRTGTAWTRARAREPLYIGDRVRAGRAARATIRYWDGIDVILEPSTLVEVLDRSAPEDEALKLWLGEVMVEVRRSAAARSATSTGPVPPPFRIRTPSAVAGAEGTRFRVRVGSEGKAEVSVTEGHVKVDPLAKGEDLTLSPGQQTAVAPGARPGRIRPASLPWASAAAGLARRERLDEPFFGELERLRSLRFLALVDLRRDALQNPARVSRLTRGEGYDLLEFSFSPTQGAASGYRERDLAGAVHSGNRDRTEAGHSVDGFHYRVLDDGRWAGAVRLSWAELSTRESLDLGPAPSPFPGANVTRGAELEGPAVAAQIQRAWAYGRTSFGVGLLLEERHGRAHESWGGGPGFPAGSELLGSAVDDEAGALSLGWSRDFGPRRDRGLVLRYQDRGVDREESSHRLGGVPVAVADRRIFETRVSGIDLLERWAVRRGGMLALRAFAEKADRDRRAAFEFDPSRLREEQDSQETARVYGLGLGFARRVRAGRQVFADLGWQRLDLSAGVFDPVLGAAYSEDRVETRTSFHAGAVLEGDRFDLRASLELAYSHDRRGFAPAGAVAPFDSFDTRLVHEVSLTVGRQLARDRRVELELIEREPVVPERVARLRLLRSF